MATYSIDKVLQNAIDIRHRDVVIDHIVFAADTFQSMLSSLEKAVYENLYSGSTIDDSIIEVMWILRGLVTKYGGRIDTEKSRTNVLGPVRTQRSDLEKQLRVEDSEGSNTLLNYLFGESYDGRNKAVSQLFEETQTHKFAAARTQKFNYMQMKRFCGIAKKDYREIYESTLSEIALTVGKQILSRIYEVEREFYNDLFALWNYQGTWIRAESNDLLLTSVDLEEPILFRGDQRRYRPRGPFKDFFDKFKSSILRYQKIFKNPVSLFYPGHEAHPKDPTLPEAIYLFGELKPENLSVSRDWEKMFYNHFYTQLK